MRKHRINKIREVSGVSQPEITPEQNEAAWLEIAEDLLEIARKLPPSKLPVSTMAQLKKEYQDIINGVDNRVFFVDRFDGERVRVAGGVTTILSDTENQISSEITKTDTGKVSQTNTVFSDDELLILENLSPIIEPL